MLLAILTLRLSPLLQAHYPRNWELGILLLTQVCRFVSYFLYVASHFDAAFVPPAAGALPAELGIGHWACVASSVSFNDNVSYFCKSLFLEGPAFDLHCRTYDDHLRTFDNLAAGLSTSLAPSPAASAPEGTRLLPSCGSRMCTILMHVCRPSLPRAACAGIMELGSSTSTTTDGPPPAQNRRRYNLPSGTGLSCRGRCRPLLARRGNTAAASLNYSASAAPGCGADASIAASSAAVVSDALRGDAAAGPLSSASGGMDLDLSSVGSAAAGLAATSSPLADHPPYGNGLDGTPPVPA